MAGLSDTDPKVARLQIELLRQSSPARRFSLMASWSTLLPQASFQEVKQHYPDELGAKLERSSHIMSHPTSKKLCPGQNSGRRDGRPRL
jgi:hypothetical protein